MTDFMSHWILQSSKVFQDCLQITVHMNQEIENRMLFSNVFKVASGMVNTNSHTLQMFLQKVTALLINACMALLIQKKPLAVMQQYVYVHVLTVCWEPEWHKDQAAGQASKESQFDSQHGQEIYFSPNYPAQLRDPLTPLVY